MLDSYESNDQSSIDDAVNSMSPSEGVGEFMAIANALHWMYISSRGGNG